MAFVLLIACANVANLHLARGTTLQKEIAIRAALGASRARIIRQLLTQNMLLALLGGAGGLLLALWGIPLLMWLLPQSLPRLSEIDVDRTVFGFTLLTSLLTGLLFGLVPAVKTSRVEMTQALKEGSRAESKNFGRFGLQSFLVVAEFALALMLLVGAGLLLNSFVRLLRVDLGFNPENVLTFNVSLPITYRGKEQAASFYAQVLARVDALPGVAGAAIINTLPLGNGVMQVAFRVEGQPASDAPTLVTQPLVSSDYFQVMSIPLLKGRYFSERDTPESVGVVNINDTFARRFFSGEDPVGKHLSLYQDSKGKPIWLEIVGIVGDVRQDALSAQPEPALYVPYTQVSDPAMLRMRQFLSDSIAQRRFSMLLLALFAGIAVSLAASGVYGVMTYLVTLKTRELGIRMALGARAGDVFMLVLRRGAALASVGVCAGLILALALSRMMRSLLYGVSVTDPVTFAVVACLMLGVALLACYVPARRATRIDPLVALRYE